MKRLLLVLHWLNLDTAIGAGITALFVARHLGVVIPATVVLSLALAVLAIYNFDHLMDARQITGTARSARHRFYQQNAPMLARYQVVLLLALLAASWYVPAAIVRAGIVLAAVALIYFLLLFIVLPKRFLFKEVIIAAVYVCGIFLPVVAGNRVPVGHILPLWMQLFLLALGNTLIFAWFDYDLDRQEGHASLARVLGRKTIYWLSLALLLILGLSVAGHLLAGNNFCYQLIIALMAMVLAFNLLLHKYTGRYEIFRLAGDAIFFLPLIGLLW